MVVRMRHTRAHTANRRSHHALTGTRLSLTKDGVSHPRHRALLDGTQYRGRSVLDLTLRRSVRRTKAEKKKGRDERQSEEKTVEKSK
jgi:ribosomal protein L32